MPETSHQHGRPLSGKTRLRRRSIPSAKVFYVGFHKTGTSSIAALLREIGYRVGSVYGAENARFVRDLAAGRYEHAMKIAARYDALLDNPWAVLFKQLDATFPGAKFILHVRNSEDWYDSILAEFDGTTTPMREYIYGVGRGDPRGNKEAYIARYDAHNQEVLRYFDRRSDLLVVDLFTDSGVTRRIAEFLGHRVYPDVFPKANPRDRQPRRWRGFARTTLRRMAAFSRLKLPGA